ncbi:MAG: heme-binding domain-containing protein [Candidatus Eisenbacteria bacterium]|nr:heme-binding domain-containing protein [Candidatus Eisenbacteria bacterium]
MSRSSKLALVVIVPVLLFAAVQLVPYGRNHANPPDGALVAFDSPATKQLAERACFDCHSNRTKWPWYSNIAPISWRIQRHVDEGRGELNLTAFDPASEDMADAAGEAGETITKGEMPPADYLLAHPEARLSSAEKQALVAGLDRTFAVFVEREKQYKLEKERRSGRE